MPFIGDPRTGFAVRREHARNVEVLALRGELALDSVPQLQPALEQAIAARGLVVVDLTEVTFIDAQGLYALLVLRARLRAPSRGLAIACPPGGIVATTFDVSGTDGLFRIFPTRKSAVAAVRR